MNQTAFSPEDIASATRQLDRLADLVLGATWANWVPRVGSFVQSCRTSPVLFSALAPLEGIGVEPIALVGTGEPRAALARLPLDERARHATAWRLLEGIAERVVKDYDAMVAVAGLADNYNVRVSSFNDEITRPLTGFMREALSDLSLRVDSQRGRPAGFVPRGMWMSDDARPFAFRGQGTLWRVRNTSTGDSEFYALKEMKYRKGPKSTAYERFEREIEITTALSTGCSAIVSVVDHGFPGDKDSWLPYYVMPLARYSLERAQHLRGKLEPVLEVGVAIARALEVCHASKVVHRDVKPGNVLLFGDELRPALADFGIAFLLDEERVTGTDADTVGSRDYAAPELFGGGQIPDIDGRADIYSLGKTLYAAVAGTHTFAREDHRAGNFDLTRRFPDPRMLHLHGLLDRMAARERENRFADMTECRVQLERALANVRAAISYSPEMYRGRNTPAERAIRLGRTLLTSKDYERTDGIRDSIADAVDAADAVAADPALAGSSMENWPEATSAAARAADHYLGAGLPLVAAGEIAGFREWLSSATAPFRRIGPQHATPSRDILRAASVAAWYGAAALGWYRRRFAILHEAMKFCSGAPNDLIRVSLVGSSPRSTIPWVDDALVLSEVIPRIEPRLPPSQQVCLHLVSGVIALYHLQQMGSSIFAEGFEVSDSTVPRFPGFDRRALTWVREFAARCHENTSLEESLGAEVFGLSSDQFRDFCSSVTPILAGAMSRYNEQDTDWNLDVDPHRTWDRWCRGGDR